MLPEGGTAHVSVRGRVVVTRRAGAPHVLFRVHDDFGILPASNFKICHSTLETEILFGMVVHRYRPVITDHHNALFVVSACARNPRTPSHFFSARGHQWVVGSGWWVDDLAHAVGGG